MRRVLLLALVTLPLAGCFQSATVIHVKADGSGTIEQRTLLTENAMDQLRTFAILGGGNPDASDPTSEAQAKAMAASIGPDVTYVSSTPVTLDKYRGRDTIYAFPDITRLRISEQPAVAGNLPLPAAVGGNTPPISFAIERKPEGNVVVTMPVPRPAIFPAGQDGKAAAPSLEQITMVRQLLAGAKLSVVVEPDGTVVQTSSPFVDGNRVTLLDVDIDKAGADPDLGKKLQSIGTDDQNKVINSIAGLKITLQSEVTIEFTPAR